MLDVRPNRLLVVLLASVGWLSPCMGIGDSISADSVHSTSAVGASVSEWVDLTPRTDLQPTAGEDGAIAYDPRQHRVLLFGGKGADDVDLDELWSLDLASHGWQRIERRGDWPPASEDHTLIYDPVGHQMILFGGENGQATNKTWSMDLGSLRWQDLTDLGGPYREDHTAVYDSRARRMIVFGGLVAVLLIVRPRGLLDERAVHWISSRVKGLTGALAARRLDGSLRRR